MGSRRLPGKVLKTLRSKSVLGHVIIRVKACPLVDQIIVATTDSLADDVVVAESARYGVSLFRGSENDVLGRYYLAAKQYSTDVIIRITSDCPLLDPRLLTQMLDKFSSLKAAGMRIDYLSNTLTRTYPRGLDAEIFTFDTLARAHAQATQLDQREHVTQYIYQHPEIFSLHQYEGKVDLSQHRWTLDTSEDFVFLDAVYSALGETDDLFTTESVLALLNARPELVKINAHVTQKSSGLGNARGRL